MKKSGCVVSAKYLFVCVQIYLRDDLRTSSRDSSEERRYRGWRLVKNVTSAAGAFSPKFKQGLSIQPTTPMPSFQVLYLFQIKNP